MRTDSIESIAIVGAGAMGAAYAAMFAEAGSFSPFFLAEGERYRRLRETPLRVNGKHYAVPVRRPGEVREPVDLVLVALKHHHLAGALAAIQSVTGPQTTILSVMNGLESEEMIGAACGLDKLVYAIAVGIDAVREGEKFTYARPGRIIFGQGPGQGDASRVARLREALTRAAIPHEVPADMMRVMWWKFMINVGINQASAVLGAPYGVFHRSADARSLMLLLMREVVALAEKLAIDLGEQDIEEWLAVLATLAPEGKTSMLQDVEAKRKTEVEIFAGRVVALGERHGVATPVNRAVLHIIRAFEQLNLPVG